MCRNASYFTAYICAELRLTGPIGRDDVERIETIRKPLLGECTWSGLETITSINALAMIGVLRHVLKLLSETYMPPGDEDAQDTDL